MSADASRLNLVQLCLSYGVSNASSTIVQLAEPTRADWNRLHRTSEIMGIVPPELLVKYLAEPGPLCLQRTLDQIESEPSCGVAGRNILLNWIRFYGILEIGIQSGVVHLPLPDDFSDSIHEEFQGLTERTFELLELPLLAEFNRRLREEVTRRTESTDQSSGMFQDFIILEASMRADPYLPNLARLTRVEVDDEAEMLNEAEQILKFPTTLVTWHITKDADTSQLRQVLPALFRAFYFLRELLNLIDTSKEMNLPYLASSVRSYNKYWTDLLWTHAGEQLLECVLSHFESWAQDAGDGVALDDIRSLREMIHTFPLEVYEPYEPVVSLV